MSGGDPFGGLLGNVGGDPHRRGGDRFLQQGHPQQDDPGQAYHPGQAGPPGGWDPGDGGGYAAGGGGRRDPGRGGGPSPKVVVTTLVVTALVAVFVGGLFGLLSGGASDDVATVVSRPSASVTTAGPEPTGAAADPGTGTGAPTTVVSRSPRPTPHDAGYVDEPWATEGLDFGILEAVSRSGDTVSVTMDRAGFLFGRQAEEYYREHPEIEHLDYAITNTNPRLRTFELTPDVVVYARFALGDGQEVTTRRIDVDTFYRKASELLGGGGELLLWLRHDPDPDGPAWYLAEQFIP